MLTFGNPSQSGVLSTLDRCCSLRLDTVTIAGDHRAVPGL
jgi:hypothetical protein